MPAASGRAVELYVQSIAEVVLAGLGIHEHLPRPAVAENAALADHVAAVGDLERLADLMVGDQDADAAIAEVADDGLDAVDRDRVNSGERLVKQDNLGIGDEATGDL